MGRKQALGWALIAIAGVLSASILTSAIVERSEAPTTSSEPSPVVGLEPLDGE